jgi:hypothetical protein
VSEEKRIDLEGLEEKARAASPGPWVVHADGMEFGGSDRSTNPGVDTADGQVVCWWGTGLCGIPQNPDAEFIASANPATVLALIEEVRSLRQMLQQHRVPDGFALVPQSMLLSKDVIGLINFHCGDTDQEEGGQFGQYTDGRLWVGYVLDDDGTKVHGLHIATDEYPEEGSTTLIEFPAVQP